MSSFLLGAKLRTSISIARNVLPILSTGIDVTQSLQERQCLSKF
jgi:hypothetical protein